MHISQTTHDQSMYICSPTPSAREAFSKEHANCVERRKSLVVNVSEDKELLFVPVYSVLGTWLVNMHA